ncbi:MAG TPA: OmpA family protein [Bryobacteraceae bacterium]|jgi:outer membrane protein OmpA-like peptidoglycan-associated protein|nr:OmpA family protein [Bryobacteraceae bacterium]
MNRQLLLIPLLGCCVTFVAEAQTVPLYQVTVTERTVKAVNYQYRTGPTPIDFRGTVLLPDSKGDAAVESKAGRTEIDAHFNKLPAPNKFGGEYLTYVLWAITPEGHPKNLGEIIPGSSDKAHTHVTTDLQAFGMIVTAEPYAAVRQPSDVVVMENQVRPDTIGSIEPVQVRYELMPRHGYTYNKPADGVAAAPQGPMVSMSEYETLLEIYQAQNAIQIAQSSGASKYAADVLGKAQSQLENARSLHDRKVDKSLVIAAAREASQTAEDARVLADQRSKDSAIASARSDADNERQKRIAAENEAAQAKQQAELAKQQAQQVQAQATADRMQAEQMAQTPAQAQSTASSIAASTAAATQVTTPATATTTQTPAIDYSTIKPPAQSETEDRSQRDIRASLTQQLNAYFPTQDTPRGLVSRVSSFEFHDATLDGRTLPNVSQLAALVNSHPGLTVEVDGYSDSGSPEAERLATARAEAVRDALVRTGVQPSAVSARGLGTSRPLGANSTAQGREANRRVEIVISGAPIGNQAAWDKSYSLIHQN